MATDATDVQSFLCVCVGGGYVPFSLVQISQGNFFTREAFTFELDGRSHFIIFYFFDIVFYFWVYFMFIFYLAYMMLHVVYSLYISWK